MRPRHPALRSALARLQRGETLSGTDAERLERQLQRLRPPHQHDPHDPAEDDQEDVMDRPARQLRRGHATNTGAERLAARSGRDHVPFYRDAGGLRVSSLGIGTYRGACDAATDRSYVEAIRLALRGGVNLIDTSLNYRDQRSERSVGRAIDAFIDQDGGSRDEIVVCSKGGFLVPGGFAAGSVDRGEVAGGIHCLAPAFLADQIERSRTNLGIETLDIYYLHNPETQLDFIDVATFRRRIVAAFEQLERAVADGFIQSYGTATWNGYWESRLSLPQLIDSAREVAGDSHHFRFVQLPFNLALDDLLDGGGRESVLDTAAELGVGVIASASLWEARLAEDLPAAFGDAMAGLDTDAQRAIHFVRSAPGIAAALVGMRSPAHVAENLGVARVLPMAATAFTRLREFVA